MCFNLQTTSTLGLLSYLAFPHSREDRKQLCDLSYCCSVSATANSPINNVVGLSALSEWYSPLKYDTLGLIVWHWWTMVDQEVAAWSQWPWKLTALLTSVLKSFKCPSRLEWAVASAALPADAVWNIWIFIPVFYSQWPTSSYPCTFICLCPLYSTTAMKSDLWLCANLMPIS